MTDYGYDAWTTALNAASGAELQERIPAMTGYPLRGAQDRDDANLHHALMPNDFANTPGLSG